MNHAMKYGATLIGLYLIVYYGSNSGTVLRAGAGRRHQHHQGVFRARRRK